MCPVHVMHVFLSQDPVYQLFMQYRMSGQILMSDVKQSEVNNWLKRVAEIVGDPDFARAASHGFRRGAACDLARDGGSLGEILAGGDWRSAAFREYLRSVADDLAARAMVQLLGEVSDSGPEIV